ncbi:MAG: protein kinase [Polyangiaceae bacterium]
MDWSEGLLVAERYRLLEVVGKGGMGAVWRARHVSLECDVAIKQISERWLGTDKAVARFLQEGRTVASLKSPHVVQVFDHGVEKGVPYIVMELLHGESLGARLLREHTLSQAATLRIIVHVARALSQAHDAGIVHRDLKPDNVFLIHNEDEEIAKVIDFGVAKLGVDSSTPLGVETASGALVGTPFYMSPEQTRGRGVDHRTDLWALGVIAFECLTGRRPFAGDTVGDVAVSICSDAIPKPSDYAEVPEAFDAWFRRAVRRQPEDRFQSAREMSAEAREALASNPDDPMPTRAIAPAHAERRVSRSAETLPADTAAAASAPATLGGLQSQAERRSRAALLRSPSVRWASAAVALVGVSLVVVASRQAPKSEPAVTAPSVARELSAPVVVPEPAPPSAASSGAPVRNEAAPPASAEKPRATKSAPTTPRPAPSVASVPSAAAQAKEVKKDVLSF